MKYGMKAPMKTKKAVKNVASSACKGKMMKYGK